MTDLFNELILYRNLNEHPFVILLKRLMQNEQPDHAAVRAEFAAYLIEAAEKNGYGGNLYRKVFLSMLLDQENIFSLACERREMSKKNPLYAIAERDFAFLKQLMEIPLAPLLSDITLIEILMDYPREDESDEKKFAFSLKNLIKHYEQNGCGLLSRRPMFAFDDKAICLNPIENCDPVSAEDIIGCEYQKRALFENTEAFLAGCPANNVLLTGARGTGKSSLVKATANKYFADGIRLIQIDRDQLSALPSLLPVLSRRGLHFIIFLDDLSFDNSELQYKHLKSILEGNASARPRNVLFCATSNRRHLIEERFADKDGSVIENGEIHASDTTNEKLSLSDRFGLSLSFTKPSPTEYIEIVRGIAIKEGLTIPEELLAQKAKEWELNQKGLSGRSARQFVNSLMV